MQEVKTPSKSILAFFDHFYPAVRSGGPARSSLGFAENLSKYYHITIVTSNMDAWSSHPLAGIKPNVPTTIGNFLVYYMDRNGDEIVKELIRANPDYLYFNSFFSYRFTIKPLWFARRMKSNISIVIAPRGELAPSALRKRSIKKRVYILAYWIFLDKSSTTYQASSVFEKNDIQNIFSVNHTLIGQDLRPRSDLNKYPDKIIEKKKGELFICLVSRIHPIKNIEMAIRCVSALSDRNVHFDIYGYKEEQVYFDMCQELSKQSNCTIRILPELHPGEVISTISNYHLFFLPTQGENFGHSILESFISARPVIISDKTPWMDLEKKQAGFDLQLNEDLITNRLFSFLRMDNAEFQLLCKGAKQIAQDYFGNEDQLKPYFEIFN